MKLRISKENSQFIVDDPSKTGSPPVGRGRTMIEAIGKFVHYNQTELGIEFVVDETAMDAEIARRRRKLLKR